jgi:hypothetical protein
MNEPIIIALIGALGGLVSGIIVSLVSPFINWGIKKKSEKLNERKKLLLEVREIVIQEYSEYEKFNEELALKKVDSSSNLIYPKALTYLDTINKHHQFHKLRPFLNKDTIDILTNSNLLDLSHRGTKLGQFPKPFQLLMDDISRIEKEWDLL